MATKTKLTNESALDPKAISDVQAPKNAEVAKAKKASAPAKETAPANALKSPKTSSAAKSKSTDEMETVAKPVEKPAKSAAQKLKTEVDPPAAQVPLVVAQDQRWLEIRAILEKLKEDTLREIRKSVKNGTEAVAAIEPGGDIYDQASSERDRELGLLLGDREREKIHSIDEALLRIDEGDYGICEECDEDIPLGRLKAMPFTRHCVKCKSDLEKLQAQTKRVEEDRAYREIPLGSEEEDS
jgi:DnaK suppressor protein